MSDNKAEEQDKKQQVEEMTDEDFEQVTGGGMRGHIYIRDTTPISDDTRKKI